MAVIQDGAAGAGKQQVGAGNLAASIAAKPFEYGALGHYKFGAATGILPAALGANSELFQFRWASAAAVALITKVRISACVTTTFFAAGVPVEIDLLRATSWSVAGTVGTAITMGASGKARTSGMGNSLLAAGDMRVATTAALGGGTKTVDTNSMASIVAPGPITASLNGQIIAPGTVLWEPDTGDGEHPLLLTTNEGFVIRSVAVPATGTWRFAVYINWLEVTTF